MLLEAGKKGDMHYTRVISFRVRPGKLEETVEIYRRSIMPEVKDLAGNLGFFLLVNRDDEEVVAFSLWDSYEHKAAPERSGFIDGQMNKLSGLLMEPYRIRDYELVLMS